jgi:type II secretory pathway pseudopilin PulG
MFGLKQNLSKKRITANGYTILEIPIAIFIIGIVMLLYVAASNSILLNRNARQQDLATRIGASLMEDVRGAEFDLIPLSGPMSHSLLNNLPNSQANLTVTDLDADSKEITIAVSWREGSSAVVHTASFTTIIVRNGI